MGQDNEAKKESFLSWITGPEMLVGISAILLSVCGLVVSIYETSLIREDQYASVWPYMEVGPSFRGEGLRIMIQNTGVGPAKIRSAAVIDDGEVKKNWGELIQDVVGEGKDVPFSQSLINRRVIPKASEQEVVFSLDKGSGDIDEQMIFKLEKRIMEGRLDVVLCYCSVYDECWRASMQEVVRAFRGEMLPERKPISVQQCKAMENSGI